MPQASDMGQWPCGAPGAPRPMSGDLGFHLRNGGVGPGLSSGEYVRRWSDSISSCGGKTLEGYAFGSQICVFGLLLGICGPEQRGLSLQISVAKSKHPYHPGTPHSKEVNGTTTWIPEPEPRVASLSQSCGQDSLPLIHTD